MDAGDGPVSLTVAAAVYPTDGDDRAALLRALDRRLHDDQGRAVYRTRLRLITRLVPETWRPLSRGLTTTR